MNRYEEKKTFARIFARLVQSGDYQERVMVKQSQDILVKTVQSFVRSPSLLLFSVRSHEVYQFSCFKTEKANRCHLKKMMGSGL